MQLHLLHLDNSLKLQKNFISESKKYSVNEIDAITTGGELRLWAKNYVINLFSIFLNEYLKLNKKDIPVTFFGSGDFHHITSLLLPIIFNDEQKLTTIIHFDNHPDWVNFSDGIHCGSWVNEVLKLRQIDKVISIGVNSNDLNFPEFKGANLKALTEEKIILYPYQRKPSFVFGNYGNNNSIKQKGRNIYWNNISELNFNELIKIVIPQIKTSQIYITLDKDVLNTNDAQTNWDQGHLSIDYVIECIKLLSQNYKIIGIDVTGDYSKPIYSGNFITRILKKSEILIDQEWKNKNQQHTSEINNTSNLKLLNFFKELH